MAEAKRRLGWKSIFKLLKESFAEWKKDKASTLGAALAYYTFFSMAPLLIIVIAIAGLAFGQEAAQGRIVDQINWLVGSDGAKAIQDVLESTKKPEAGILATIIGVITLLIGASTAFTELQDALNTIWDIEPEEHSGVWSLMKNRFLSFAMVLGIGFLLLVSLLLSALLTGVGEFMSGLLPLPEPILQGLNMIFSVAVITVLFAMIYKILPDARIEWKDVWIGSLVTSVLFTLGKFLIGLYLGQSSLGSAYGAAGSLVIVLVWVYYSVQIVFFGAEFTQVYANTYGSHVTTRSAHAGRNFNPSGVQPQRV